MANETIMGWSGTATVGIRIHRFNLRNLDGRVLRSTATLVMHQYVAEFDVLQRMPGNTGDDRRLAGSTIRYHDVADVDPSQLTDSNTFWPAHAAAQTQKEWHIDKIAHGEV